MRQGRTIRDSEVSACIAVAQELGLVARSGARISSSSRSVLLLEPCSVVAKVGPSSELPRFATEVELAKHVQRRRGPVVPALLRADPGPPPAANRSCRLGSTHRPGLEVTRSRSQRFPPTRSYESTSAASRDSCGVDPVSWIPRPLGEENPRCRGAARRTRRSFELGWSSGSDRAGRRKSFRESLSRVPGRSGTGHARPSGMGASARTA